MKGLAAVLTILICCTLPAQDAVSAGAERLSKTRFFAFGGVGFAGTMSQGEKDFTLILTQAPEIALARFEALYARGNPEARLYALAGIRKLDPNHFKELITSVKDSKEPVGTMAGCIGETRTFGLVAKEIESGQYDYWIERASKSK